MSQLKKEIVETLKELRRQAGYEPNAWYEEKEESFLETSIDRVEEKTAKAYGGCKNCFGKGYATVRYGLKYEADMIGDKEYFDPIKTHMEFCSCDRGKQLEKFLTSLKSGEGKGK